MAELPTGDQLQALVKAVIEKHLFTHRGVCECGVRLYPKDWAASHRGLDPERHAEHLSAAIADAIETGLVTEFTERRLDAKVYPHQRRFLGRI